MKPEKWQEQIEQERARKDLFFARHPESPLPPETRDVFSGLAYWPIDPAYCFELVLHEHQEKSVTTVQITGGQDRSLWCWGEFRFSLQSEMCVLQAYKNSPEDDGLFVPFRDQTNGVESYGAGRYLDLDSAPHTTDSGQWLVDFNYAYNPWCAYSNAYTCLLVPYENWLNVAIRAGEMLLPDIMAKSSHGKREV